MTTGLVRRYGERDTVQGYILVAVNHFKRSKEVYDTAIKMYNHIAKTADFDGMTPSMQAMAIVHLAMIEHYQEVLTSEWSGDDSASYNTLLGQSKKLKKALDKCDEFQTLKRRRKEW